MQMKAHIKGKCKLQRRHTKLGEIICWDMLSEDGLVRLAVIRELYDNYLIQKMSWREFRIKYWQASVFWGGYILIAKSRKELIDKVLESRKTNA